MLAVFAFCQSACAFESAKPFTVPFRLIDNRIFVNLYINGRGPYACIFDTGARQVLSSRVARELGLKVESAGSTSGVGDQSVELGEAHVRTLSIGSAEVHDLDTNVLALDDTPNVFGTQRVQAIVGAPFFEKYQVTIDYDRLELKFLPAGSPPPASALAVIFERPDNIPVLRASLDGVPARFGIDTGARSALLLYGPFIERNKLREKYNAKLEGITGWGIGGPVRSQIARAKSLNIGAASVADIVIRLSTQKSGLATGTHLDGLIGPDVLRQFIVTFDYQHNGMYFEKGTHYGGRDAYDRTGAWLGQRENHFVVIDVIAGSPATEVGLATGDVVLKLNGRSTSSLLLPETRAKMRTLPAGTKVQFEIRRGTAIKQIAITLRDLV